MVETNKTPNTSMQANNGESKMPLPNTLPGIGITNFKNMFREYV